MLLAASLISWAIIFRKRMVVRRARRDADRFENSFWSGGDLSSLYRAIESRGNATGMESIFEFGFREFARLRAAGRHRRRHAARGLAPRHARGPAQGDRAARAQSRDARDRRLDQSLRGLVRYRLGHHERLQFLGNVQQATLAQVAPGIAEALIATAVGLFAAIPAVVAYNRYADQVSRLELRYDAFMEELSTILQRYAGRGRAPRASGPPSSARRAGLGGARGAEACPPSTRASAG